MDMRGIAHLELSLLSMSRKGLHEDRSEKLFDQSEVTVNSFEHRE